MAVTGKTAPLWAALTAVLVVSGAAATGPELVSSDDGGLVVLYEAGRVVTTRVSLGGRDYTRVALEGAEVGGEPGDPELPVARMTVAVPDCDAIDVVVSTSGTTSRSGVRVLPALSLVRVGAGEVSSYARTEGDRYSTVGPWPAAAATVSEPRWLWGQRFVTIEFNPCQYDPSGGTLVSHAAVEVRLGFSGVRAASSPRRLSGRQEDLLESLLPNYETARAWRAERPGRGARARDDYFDLSSNWLRMSVDAHGIYTVTYDDLVGAGVSPASVDPASVRVFAGPGVALDPRVSVPPATWMQECAILVADGADGSFDQGDRVVFYGMGVDGWSDAMGLTEPPDEPYYEHRYASLNAYWMTWESFGSPFSGVPLRMEADDLQSSPTPLAVSDYWEREHFEDNKFDVENRSDGFFMRAMGRTGLPEWATFRQKLFNVVTDSTGLLRGRFDGNSSGNHYAVFSLNGDELYVGEWDGYLSFVLEVDAVSYLDYLPGEVENEFVVHLPRADSLHADDQILIDWFDFEYWRLIRADRVPDDGVSDDQVAFGSSGRTGVLEYSADGFSSSDVSVFKIVDRYTARTVPGVSVTSSAGGFLATFQDEVSDTASYVAASTSGFLTPTFERRTPGGLRGDTNVDYAMIVYDDFESELTRLADFRATEAGGGFGVRVAALSEVYDEFSWGVADPAAIRNYLKHLYDSAETPPTHVLLAGDASYDYRSYLATGLTVFVPTYYVGADAWPSDTWFVGFESDSYYNPAMAVGRMPAESAAELRTMVDKVLRHEREAEPGLWKNRVVIAADDEYNQDRPGANEIDHTIQAEMISSDVLPWPLDRKKVYLVNYDKIGGEKPAARVDFLDAWNEGTILINYTGHGNEELMAHEHLFLIDDISVLKNIDRLPLFFAASCRLNKFDMPADDSVGELLAMSPLGGTVASIGSTRDSGSSSNSRLNRAFLRHAFGNQREAPTSFLDFGQALQAGFIETNTSSYSWGNNAKFVLVGDPAAEFASPEGSGTITPEDLGPVARRSTVSIGGENGGATAGLEGVALIRVEDTADTSGYIQPETSEFVAFSLPGDVVFEGASAVAGGTFTADFIVSAMAEEGPNARIRAYFYGSDLDGSMSLEGLTIADSVEVSDAVGPSITMEFEGGSTSVLPGSQLEVLFSDESGINTVNSDPEDAITMRIDGSQEPTDVTHLFSYLLGSHTEGGFSYDVSSLGIGSHSVRVAASDNMGNRSEENLSFEVVPSMDFEILNVANHPNPFPEGGSRGTRILFQIPVSAAVTIDVFTVGGRRVKSIDGIAATAGSNEVYWDGLDADGDELANGVYLYRILAVSDEYRGDKAEAIGRAVIMR
jgi:hypothetical protein